MSPFRRWWLCAFVALALVSSPVPAHGAWTGVVFVDLNRNGERDRGELGRAGIAVSNGREVVRTNVYGRYTIGPSEGGLVLTCPDQFACPVRWQPEAGDFALVPAPAAGEFFFVHVSDVHAFDDIGDFSTFAMSSGWPSRAARAERALRDLLGSDADARTIASLRAALAPYGDTDGLADADVVDAYFEELLRPGSPLGQVADAARSAMAEIASLQPEFVLSTGGQVLDAGRGSPEAIEAWFAFYGEITKATGIPFFDTMGGSELAGIQNGGFPTDDPRYGKGYFRSVLGPAHYSFDRGEFHFVALDTHRPDPRPFRPRNWVFGRMPDEVREWLVADLQAHPDMVPVVLNHEPFHSSDTWPTEYTPADDEGVLAARGVRYALAGHVHANGLAQRDGTTHITTGALSGGRWVLPVELQERGYRLFYAKDRRLYHAWKRTGEPVVAFLGREQQLELPEDTFIGVAADRGGPFERVEVTLDGEPLSFERWGDYFLRVSLPEPAGSLILRATSADGTTRSAELQIPAD